MATSVVGIVAHPRRGIKMRGGQRDAAGSGFDGATHKKRGGPELWWKVSCSSRSFVEMADSARNHRRSEPNGVAPRRRERESAPGSGPARDPKCDPESAHAAGRAVTGGGGRGLRVVAVDPQLDGVGQHLCQPAVGGGGQRGAVRADSAEAVLGDEREERPAHDGVDLAGDGGGTERLVEPPPIRRGRGN